jgi:hypothetical protein
MDWQSGFMFAVDKIGQGFTDNPKRDEDYTMALLSTSDPQLQPSIAWDGEDRTTIA